MATTKKAAETAENTEVSAAETTADTVTIKKSQLDKLLGMYDELQEIKKSVPTDRKAEKIKQDKERLEKLQKRIQREQIKYEPARNVSKTYNEIDRMGQKTITGKMAISKEDYSCLLYTSDAADE